MIIFLDIDGTCANATERFKSAGPEPKGRGPEYWKWLHNVQSIESLSKDKPVQCMSTLANIFNSHIDTIIIYLTGREEIYRDTTVGWLHRFNFPEAKLIMRPIGDKRSNGEYKEFIIKTAKDYEILVIDDDYTGEIEEICYKNKWTFLKACSGGVREYGKKS